MEMKSWPLTVLSVLSLVVIAGAVAWAEVTHAKPHVAAAAAPTEGKPVFTVCATGNYAAYVELTETKTKSPTAQPGKCVTEPVESADETYEIKIYGLDGATPFEVGEDEVEATGKVTATGTADNPDETSE
ncbi:hypothetical protein [Cryptosporangium sp. NPDC051539]|uniref:hypothetical protein n=1 Tax=Cryptosporangium sp. NPDC051539 TaxID=3363962 RepID=UPI0037B9C50E